MKEKQLKNIVSEGVSDLFYIWWKELKLVIKDQGVIIFFIILPLGYPLLYTYIYTNEVIHNVPTVAVDNDHSNLSRQYLRLVNGTADVSIVSYCNDMEEAKLMLKKGEAYGIIYIPESFNRDIARGTQTHVTIYCDMSGMLYYKAILSANTNVSLAMNKQIKIEHCTNTTDRQDEVSTAPIEYEDISIFNPQNGFASFLIPAVLVLILQQSLLLGIGLSAGTARENNQFRNLIPISRHYHGTLRIVTGKSLTYLMIYAVMSIYVLCFIPKIFSLTQIPQVGTLYAFIIPYLLACIFFAMTCSVFVHHRETCIMIFVFSSLPFLFISGISWPGSAVPQFWKVISYLFPSTFGINGFVRINNTSATLHDVEFEYQALWLQAGFYFITTCIVYRWQIIISRRPAYERLKRINKK